MQICGHGISDGGYYGKTGKFTDHKFNTQECCGKRPTLVSNYDDTPGFKETVYEFKCDECSKSGNYTCSMDGAISSWNEIDT